MAQFGPAASHTRMRSTCIKQSDFLAGYQDCHLPLGQGSFGVVSQFKCRSTKQLRAIKTQILSDARDMTEWLREETALTAAAESLDPDASCVARLFASCLGPVCERHLPQFLFGQPQEPSSRHFSYLVLENCGFNLAEVLQNSEGKPLSEALLWSSHLFRGLSFIHSINILHRDIKPSNMLLAETCTGRWDLKISDFGKSRIGAEMMTAAVATLPYRAPEILFSSVTQQAGPPQNQQHNRIQPHSFSVSEVWHTHTANHTLAASHRQLKSHQAYSKTCKCRTYPLASSFRSPLNPTTLHTPQLPISGVQAWWQMIWEQGAACSATQPAVTSCWTTLVQSLEIHIQIAGQEWSSCPATSSLAAQQCLLLRQQKQQSQKSIGMKPTRH